MKKVKIFHNPGAGKGDYTKKELMAILESQGYQCGYSSTKSPKWSKTDLKEDFIVIAGGDGTVRRVVVKILAQNSGHNPPIALLPLGTANNIAKSLNITGHAKEIVGNLNEDKKQKFDAGIITGLQNAPIFLESFGYGIFPLLMQSMKEEPPKEAETPEQEIVAALERMHRLVLGSKAASFNITVNGSSHTGNYLMVEVMNISSIGPNLGLSPKSDPGDGEFEVVLIPESHRHDLATYISHKINGVEKEYFPLIIKGNDITIESSPGLFHIDDELVESEKQGSITIRPDHAMMEFLVQ